jgi:hypothetical protein
MRQRAQSLGLRSMSFVDYVFHIGRSLRVMTARVWSYEPEPFREDAKARPSRSDFDPYEELCSPRDSRAWRARAPSSASLATQPHIERASQSFAAVGPADVTRG